MNIKQLHDICSKAIAEGNGDKPVCFDTLAMTFNTHLINVSGAYYNEHPEPMLCLSYAMHLEDVDYNE